MFLMTSAFAPLVTSEGRSEKGCTSSAVTTVTTRVAPSVTSAAVRGGNKRCL